MDTLPAVLPAPPLAQPEIRIVVRKSIFRTDTRRHFAVPHDASLLTILVAVGMATWRDGAVHLPGNVRVEIDGDVIEREHWHLVRPRPGRLVNAYLIPANQRQAILIGASIVIAVAAVYTGGAAASLAPVGYGAFAGAAAGAAVSLTGSYDLTAPWPAA